MKRCPNCGKQFPDDANFCPVDAGRLEPDTAGVIGTAVTTGAAGALVVIDSEGLEAIDTDAGETQRGHAPASGPPTAADSALGGRFELAAQVGGGATGEVYQGLDRETGLVCAVKLVHPAVFPNPLLLQRAERELKQLERVDLPEVARVLGHGRLGDQLWVALEMVPAAPLQQLIASTGPMPPLRACRLVRQVAHGLAEAAKQGVIHRDLSAKNILVADGDAVKIINFPIAVPFSDRVQGVAEFLSPEQVEGKPADQRSSIYSLGALLYYAVTGRPPFLGDPVSVHRSHVSEEPVRVSQLVAVPDAVEAVIMKALEKASARRFMTLHQMIGELDAILAGGIAAQGAVAAQGKAKGGPVGPAQTLVGVSAFSPQGHPVAVPIAAHGTPPGPAHAPPPSIGSVGPGAPTRIDPMMLGVKSGELGGGRGPFPPSGPVVGGGGPPRSEQPGQHGQHGQHGQQPQASVPLGGRPPDPFAQPSPPVAVASTGKGKGKGGGGPADTKGKFRETMWFKKGELDEAAAAAAAVAQEGDLVHDKSDALPIEDRYRDDGTLDRRDAERLSLRTGATQMMKAMREPAPRRNVSESELVGELRRSRVWLVVFIVVVMAVVGGVVFFFLS